MIDGWVGSRGCRMVEVEGKYACFPETERETAKDRHRAEENENNKPSTFTTLTPRSPHHPISQRSTASSPLATAYSSLRFGSHDLAVIRTMLPLHRLRRTHLDTVFIHSCVCVCGIYTLLYIYIYNTYYDGVYNTIYVPIYIYVYIYIPPFRLFRSIHRTYTPWLRLRVLKYLFDLWAHCLSENRLSFVRCCNRCYNLIIIAR